jgi:hypothetical protein
MLDLNDQNRFLDYKLTLEIIENEADTLADYDNHIHEMFERLQGGKRLSDDDKYWNRYYSNSPLVKFAFDIISNKEIKEYLNIKKFSSNNRKGLTNICGLIGAFLFADISNNFSYWPAFRCQFNNLNKTISSDDKNNVIKFLNYYINIIKSSHNIFKPEKDEKKLDYKNNARYINMIMIDYKENKDKNMNMWIEFFNISRKNHNFTNGTASLYNNLSRTNKSNNSEENIRVRLNRVEEFFRNKKECSEQHSIKYIDMKYI